MTSSAGLVGCRRTRNVNRMASPQAIEPCSPRPSGSSISPRCVPGLPCTASMKSCLVFSLYSQATMALLFLQFIRGGEKMRVPRGLAARFAANSVLRLAVLPCRGRTPPRLPRLAAAISVTTSTSYGGYETMVCARFRRTYEQPAEAGHAFRRLGNIEHAHPRSAAPFLLFVVFWRHATHGRARFQAALDIESFMDIRLPQPAGMLLSMLALEMPALPDPREMLRTMASLSGTRCAGKGRGPAGFFDLSAGRRQGRWPLCRPPFPGRTWKAPAQRPGGGPRPRKECGPTPVICAGAGGEGRDAVRRRST